MAEAWTPERVEILRNFTDRGWSASDIGAAMGVSRNAVIGIWHRKGLGRPALPAWSQSRWRKVKKMWFGGHTAAQIGAAVGASEIAVGAKIRRMRRKSMAQLGKRKTRMEVVEAIAGSPASRRVEVPGKFKFLELGPGQCHWPTGEGAAMMFCGDPKLEPFPYCAAHARMAYHPSRSRRQGEAVYLGLVVARRAKQVKINGSVVALSPDGAAA